jgi:hypothetical protein
MEKEHERKLALDDKSTELDIASFKNKAKIKSARQKFYLDDEDGNGTADIVDSANRGDLDALKRQLETALAALEHTSAKSPNGHSMASEGVEAPKAVTRTKKA